MKNNPFCPSSGFAAFFFCCFFASYASNAQNITTIAGKGGTGYNGDGIAATAAQLYAPNNSFVDASGAIFIADMSNNRVRKVSAAGVISTVAGNGTSGYLGDGGAATAARLFSPSSVVADATGNLYIACRSSIRKVSTSGVISTIAGDTVLAGYSGDGGPATAAYVSATFLAIDGYGNLYFPDVNTVRKIDTSGIITSIAGTPGYSGYSGDGGPATNALLTQPIAVAVNSSGSIIFVDNQCVRKISTSGIISTIAGSVSTYGFSGDGGPATAATFCYPSGLAYDNAGNIYIADRQNSRVRKVNAAGIITTIAGVGYYGAPIGSYNGDGAAATVSNLNYPTGVALDASGNIYISDNYNDRVRKVDASGIITTVAGMGNPGFSGDGGAATAAQFYLCEGLCFDTSGNLYIADGINSKIRKVSPAGVVSTIAGTGVCGVTGDGGPATAAQICGPWAVCADRNGNIYIGDGTARIRKINSAGIISTFAGTGTSGYSGDGGPATAGTITEARAISVDRLGNVYLAEINNHVIRKISTTGIISTFAGTGVSGVSGDGGPATAAKFGYVNSCTIDKDGNMYVTDWSPRVRKIDTFGIVTTFAGNGNRGYNGDGMPATAAWLNVPKGVGVDTLGNVYIADSYNNRVRKVDASGIISTFAGTGVVGYSGDGALATGAQAFHPAAVTTDIFQNVYFSDYNNTVRKVGTCLAPVAGAVTGVDSVCPSYTTTLTAATTGGTWASTNSAIATVSATGVVTGVASGTATIYYIVTNTCGIDTTGFAIRVRTASSCPSGVGGIAQPANGLSVYPNPNSGSFTISFASATNGEVSAVVTNMLGKKISSFIMPANKETQVKLNVPAGLYFVTTTIHGEQAQAKIIIE